MDDRKYVKFSYTLDVPYCNFDEFKLVPVKNDEFFNEIKFEENFVTLYFKEDFILQENQSIKELEKYAEKKLFAIFLKMVINSSSQNFKMRIEESHIDDGKNNIYLESNCSVKCSFSGNAKVRRADGSIATEEEVRQMILKANKDKMEQIILNSNDIMTIQEQDKERFLKLFKVKDPVIKYFILYSWLSEFFLRNGREFQDGVNTFIVNTNTYATIPGASKRPPLRNGRNDKTYFTYLRNLMGHTVTEALVVSDATIIDEVKNYTSWLIQILLEKLT